MSDVPDTTRTWIDRVFDAAAGLAFVVIAAGVVVFLVTVVCVAALTDPRDGVRR